MKISFKSFKNWGISAKVGGVAISSALLVSFAVIFYILPILAGKMKDEKSNGVKQVVETVYSIIEEYDQLVKENRLTLADAQREAKEKIRGLRYSGNEYFWINDMKPTMIMHPFKPELEGKNLSNNTDPNGVHLFLEMVQTCRRNGEGFVEYYWPKPGKDEPQPKVSYVKLIKSWGWIVGSGVYVDDIEAAVAEAEYKIILCLVTAFILAGLMGLFQGRYISRPLKKLTEISKRIALGETDMRIESTTSEEIGRLEKSLSEMVESIKEQTKVSEMIAEGQLDINIKVRSENDILSKSMQKMVDTLKHLDKELLELSASAQNGGLSRRGDASLFKGGYKKIVEGINKTLDAVIFPIQDGNKVLTQMATGDFTARIKTDYKGDFQLLKNSVNKLGDSLTELIRSVNEAVHSTVNESNEISAATEQMAANLQAQTVQTAEAASAIEEMTKTIMESTRNSAAAASNANIAGKIAMDGGKVVEETIEGINRISAVVQQAAATMTNLGNSSDQIGEIIQVIEDIADQTNLLALNAAIEAARAGEQGRGFAVVADEVRKLAERTTKATKEIASMIKHIQQDTKEAVEKIEEGTGEVEKGQELVIKSGTALKQIIAATNKVVDEINQIASAGEEQSTSAEQISKSVESINNAAQESSAGVQQTARAAEDLTRLTQNLEGLVAKFKITEAYNSRIKESVTFPC